MNDAVIYFGAMKLYVFGMLAVIAFLWGSFVYYKKAVESHFEEKTVLDSVILAAFWAFILSRMFFVVGHLATFWGHLSRIFLYSSFPGMDGWGALVGLFGGVFMAVRKIKGKVVDWFDLLALGITAGLAVFYAGLGILTRSWFFGVTALTSLLVFGFLWSIETKYRTFSWYKFNKTSSKSGLILGLSISYWGLTSLMGLLVMNYRSWPAMVLAAMVFVGGLVLVYIRSGRTVQEDIKLIFKNVRK